TCERCSSTARRSVLQYRDFTQLSGSRLQPGAGTNPRAAAATQSCRSRRTWPGDRLRLRAPRLHVADVDSAGVRPGGSLQRVTDEALSVDAEDARSLDRITIEQLA